MVDQDEGEKEGSRTTRSTFVLGCWMAAPIVREAESPTFQRATRAHLPFWLTADNRCAGPCESRAREVGKRGFAAGSLEPKLVAERADRALHSKH